MHRYIILFNNWSAILRKIIQFLLQMKNPPKIRYLNRIAVRKKSIKTLRLSEA